MTKKTSKPKKLIDSPHFYFWLGLPITILIIAVYVGAQIILLTTHTKQHAPTENYAFSTFFQVLSLAYIVYLQYQLWARPTKIAVIVIGILGLCLFPVTVPIDSIIFLILYFKFVSATKIQN